MTKSDKTIKLRLKTNKKFVYKEKNKTTCCIFHILSPPHENGIDWNLFDFRNWEHIRSDDSKKRNEKETYAYAKQQLNEFHCVILFQTFFCAFLLIVTLECASLQTKLWGKEEEKLFACWLYFNAVHVLTCLGRHLVIFYFSFLCFVKC